MSEEVSEQVVDDRIDFDKIDLQPIIDELKEAFTNDYKEPIEIDDFIISSIDNFGRVISEQLPPAAEHNGSYICTTIERKVNVDQVEEVPVKILSTGNHWYILVPEIDVEVNIAAIVEIDQLLKLME